MIDRLDLSVPFSWVEPIHGGRRIELKEDDSLDYECLKRRKVLGSYEAAAHVRTMRTGFLEVEVNPCKFLQGHNLWGSDDAVGLFLGVMDRLSEVLGQQPSDEDRAAWLRGEVKVRRVDLTYSWALDCKEDVNEWIRAASEQAYMKWRGKGMYKPGSLTFGAVEKGARALGFEVLIYGKGDEVSVKGHTIHPDLPHADKLWDWAQNKLRMEVRLRSKELNRMGWMYLRDWANPATVKALHATYVSKIQMNDVQSIHVTQQENPRLKPRHVSAIENWKSGKDLQAIHPARSFYRLKKEILDIAGLDISIIQAATEAKVVPLRELRLQPVSDVPEGWGELVTFVPAFRPQLATLDGFTLPVADRLSTRLATRRDKRTNQAA